MSIPHDHHFIPAFYLRQWANASGKVVEYSTKYKKLIAKLVGPDSTGFKYDLYAFNDLPLEQAQFIEQKFFDFADRTANEALQLHLTNADSSKWTQELRSAWSRFIIALHLRHPDAMPELRAAAQSIWEGSGASHQARYEEIKKPEDPPTFDEFLAQRDPLTAVKMRVNLIVKTFDNDIVGLHLNGMHWSVVHLERARHELLLSDRPAIFSNMREKHGYVALPISPSKLFLAVNDETLFNTFRSLKPDYIVRSANVFTVERARNFVWARDHSQTSFIQKFMSKRMEPTPLFPNIGWGEQSGPTSPVPIITG